MVPQSQLDTHVADIIRHLDQLQVREKDASSCAIGRPFIPRHMLQQHLTRDKIQLLLAFRSVRDVDPDTIRNHYISVFGILVQIRRYEQIGYFISHQHFADDRLPFLDRESWFEQYRGDFFQAFYEAQWKYCAQDFRPGRLDNIFIHPERILPFESRSLIKRGADSRVEKVEIHKDYHSLGPIDTRGKPLTNFFVLKSYRAENVDLYYNEVHAYKMLNQPDLSDNLVRLYGCWKQEETYSILLEYAGGGTLADIFQRSHPTSKEDRLRFWSKLILILNPICRIHHHVDPSNKSITVEGVHQDIKPANILSSSALPVSDFDYNFKLVDLGLTYFHTITEKKAKRRMRDGRGTQMFSAPECYRSDEDEFRLHSADRAESSKDIWSLGCVFSMALVWCVLGPTKLKDYQDRLVAATDEIDELRDSSHSGCFHNGEDVSPVVAVLHNEVLKAKGTYDQIISDLVPIIEDMLDFDPLARPTASKVRDRCQKALKRAIQLSETDESMFPRALRTLPNPIEPPQTPPEVPPRPHQLLNGLNLRNVPLPESPQTSPDTRPRPHQLFISSNLENIPLAELPQTPERTSGNNRDSYVLASPAHSHRSVPTISIEHDATARHRETGASMPEGYLLPSSPTQDTGYRPNPFWESQSRPNSGAYNGAPSTNAERPTLGLQSPANADVPGIHRDDSRRTHRRSTQSKRGSQKISRPFANINEVHSWLEKWKRDSSTAPPRPVSDVELGTLRGRDQIFLVDNSLSMKEHRSKAKRTLGSLAYLVKHFDPDGIELYFTKTSQTRRHKDRHELLTLFDSVEFEGHGGMETTLGEILEKCSGSGLRSMLKAKLKGSRRGVNIYVLTDGVWGCEDDSLCGIPELVKTTVAKMNNRVKLGIQFIQFGNHPVGTWRLQQLDDEWRKHGIDKDIIDHTPWDGNVYKMLLGSFDSSWDDAPSTPDNAQSSSSMAMGTRYA